MKEPKGFRHRFLEVSDARLHFVEGPARGTPLVLVPAQSMPWESYLPVLALLAERFHCFAVDVRGHGRSSHTPDKYTFSTLGRDLIAVLEQVVQRPAVVSGNSSGGIIAAYAAAHAPDLVCCVVPEDPPFFSSEWPELKNCYAHRIFELCVTYLDRPDRDLRGFFANFIVPAKGGQKVMRFPALLARFIAWRAARFQRKFPGQAVDLRFLPFQARLFLKSLSEYDVAFTRAFYDGRACDIDHAALLAAIRCPMLLLQADWFEHESLGLVGAMTDRQAERAMALVANSTYQRIHGGHIIHQEKPRVFARLLMDFAAQAGCL